LKEAVDEILSNSSFKSAAAQIGASFAKAGGTDTAADLLVGLVAGKVVPVTAGAVAGADEVEILNH
jgi:UDP:flavonoid glycosyltransferase YjiC (YdhE family)